MPRAQTWPQLFVLPGARAHPRVGRRGPHCALWPRPAARLPGRLQVRGEREPVLSASFKGFEMSCSGAIRAGAGCPLASPVLGWGCERELTPGKLGVRSARLLTLGPLTLARVWPWGSLFSHTHAHTHPPPYETWLPVYQGPECALCTFYISLNYFRLDRGEERGRKRNQ